MKLTRRKIILAFATASALVAAKSSLRLIRAQSPRPLSNSKSEPLITSEWLKNGELDKERIYQHFLQLAAGGVEDHPVLLSQGIETSPYREKSKIIPVF